MLFVLPLSDHAGHFLKDFISTKSSLPWNEMAIQHHGVVIGAYGSLHEKKPEIHRSFTNMGAEVYIPQMVQVSFPGTIPGVPVFFPDFFPRSTDILH